MIFITKPLVFKVCAYLNVLNKCHAVNDAYYLATVPYF